MDISSFEEKISVKFKNKDILKQAFVHRSYLNENPSFYLKDNERLEFLGDAVLELVVTDFLYRNYSNPEGELTSWRASLVNTKMLARISERLGINKYLFLSRGEAKDNGRARQCILANTFEALVGAIYLDQGYEKARSLIEREILKELPEIINHQLYRDPKSRFQEEAQERLGITPVYEVISEEGPDHNKKFTVGVFLGEEMTGKGEGNSKQEAQEKAAEKSLKEKGW